MFMDKFETVVQCPARDLSQYEHALSVPADGRIWQCRAAHLTINPVVSRRWKITAHELGVGDIANLTTGC